MNCCLVPGLGGPWWRMDHGDHGFCCRLVRHLFVAAVWSRMVTRMAFRIVFSSDILDVHMLEIGDRNWWLEHVSVWLSFFLMVFQLNFYCFPQKMTNSDNPRSQFTHRLWNSRDQTSQPRMRAAGWGIGNSQPTATRHGHPLGVAIIWVGFGHRLEFTKSCFSMTRRFLVSIGVLLLLSGWCCFAINDTSAWRRAWILCRMHHVEKTSLRERRMRFKRRLQRMWSVGCKLLGADMIQTQNLFAGIRRVSIFLQVWKCFGCWNLLGNKQQYRTSQTTVWLFSFVRCYIGCIKSRLVIPLCFAIHSSSDTVLNTRNRWKGTTKTLCQWVRGSGKVKHSRCRLWMGSCLLLLLLGAGGIRNWDLQVASREHLHRKSLTKDIYRFSVSLWVQCSKLSDQ